MYEPLVRPEEAEMPKSPKAGPTAGTDRRKRAPSTVEKLWFLLEPTSPLTCHSGPRQRPN